MQWIENVWIACEIFLLNCILVPEPSVDAEMSLNQLKAPMQSEFSGCTLAFLFFFFFSSVQPYYTTVRVKLAKIPYSLGKNSFVSTAASIYSMLQ